LDTKQQELEKGIKLIHKLKRKSLTALSEATKERIKSQKLFAEYEVKFSEFKKKKNELMNEARKEAQKVLENANALIEHTIKEIREEKKQAGELRKEFEQLKKELVKPTVIELEEQEQFEKLQEKSQNPISTKVSKNKIKTDIQIGSIVKYTENQSTGRILELDSNKKLALVEINGIKFKIKTNLLEVADLEDIQEDIIARSAFADNIKFDVQTRLDLRGERVETALRKVDEFVSNAILSNVSLVSIIHGKGTGALREAIQDFLKHHQSIKSFRDGDLVEGGSGVTIIEF
jgi:DNA mismatch repair protein MutS2